MDAPMTATAVTHLEPEPLSTFRLPFYKIYELIETVGRQLGLGRPRQTVLLYLMRQTAPMDWTDPSRVPTCFRQQQDLADQLGMTTRQLRTHEAALAERGLIEIATGANGRRSGHMLKDGRRLGLNFGPMLSRLHQLVNLADALHRRQTEIRQLRLECSAARRAVRHLLERQDLTLSSCERAAVIEHCSSWPDRYAGLRTRSALRALLLDIEAVEDSLVAAIPTPDPSAATAQFLPPVQNTNEKDKNNCTRGAAMKKRSEEQTPQYYSHARKNVPELALSDQEASTPDHAEKDPCQEPKVVHPALPSVTADFLRHIATDDFKLILAYRMCGSELSPRTYRSLGIELALHIGVSTVVYDEVAEVAGDLGALLGTIYIDQRRYDCQPIRSPSAALRSFGRLHRAGQFNWTGLLKALARRVHSTDRPQTVP